MTDLRAAFQTQAIACGNLGSPFMERLLSYLADAWPTQTSLAAFCSTFSGDIGPSGASLPLRVAGGLHALRLQGDPALAAIYPPNDPNQNEFETAILHALTAKDDFLTEWCQSPPQTNELRRSAALIPGAHVLADRFGLPIVLSELGASGGLNLLWDHFLLKANNWSLGPKDATVVLQPDWHGHKPPAASVLITERRGVDLRPQNPKDDSDLLRLTAYLWPDQPERLANTRAAAQLPEAPVEAGDAIEWLSHRLENAPKGHIHLVQNTVAWQYFPQSAQARGRALFEAAGQKATADAPLAWLQLETDGDQHALGGAALTLQIWPTGEILTLGRADFHGRWVRWSYEQT